MATAHERLDTRRFRNTLEHARRALELRHEASEDELDAIESEREIEPEELAQEEQRADVRSRVSHNQFAQLRQIDGALERLERGTFGACVECGRPVSEERLDAQPWAATCSECVAAEPGRDDPADRPQDGRADIPDEPASEELRGSPLPPELAAMEDEEVATTIREVFRLEVGEALDDVQVACSDGVVTLAGEVPNEALPEVARQIVEDELGFDVVDRMLITETAGGPRSDIDDVGETRSTLPLDTLETSDEELESEVSDDILEVEEEGLVFVPPTRPVPERKD